MRSVALQHEPPDEDQRVSLRLGWKALEALLAAKGDDPVPRITYLDGVLELTAKLHESISRGINLLLFVWAEENQIDLEPTGSWTLKNRLKAAGAEPDECWVVGDRPNATRPDLALEVIHTHGDLDKLEVYRRLGVREVWFWMKGALSVHVLHPRGYVRAARSSVFPALDLKQLATFVRHPSRARAPRLYRAALRRSAH
ncbi:MAG: Uma2 family endonuclease [Archangium sp.]|nr:Uma2 family endonuclease [Archangium sp.]